MKGLTVAKHMPTGHIGLMLGFLILICALNCPSKIVSEYDQEIPQSQTMEGEKRQYSMHTSLFLYVSFYFVNCVIISCELYYDNSFGCILTNHK